MGHHFYVCNICHEKIRENKGERPVRLEKKLFRLEGNKIQTFWTMAHKKCKARQDLFNMPPIQQKRVN